MSALRLRPPEPAKSAEPPRPALSRVRAAVTELFPVAPEPPATRTTLARWALILGQVALVALGALVMLVRVAGRPAWQSVYAEDPALYLPWALAHPWHLLESYAGYLQLAPRLIAQIAALVPIKHAAAAMAAGGALVASGCALFAYHASSGLVRSRWLRVLVGLSVLLLPVAQLEIADNAVNSIWYLLVALFWAALWRPRSRAGAAIAAVVGFAAAASTSLGLVFIPLFAARVVVVPRRIREHAVTIGWALGCVLQVGVILASHSSRLQPRDPLNAVRYYTREVLLPAFGWHLSWHLRHAAGLTGATAIAGVLILVVLAAVVATQPGRARVFVIFAVGTSLVFTAITSLLAWGGPGQILRVTVEHGARYSTLPILLLDAALIVAADAYAARYWARPKAVVAVAALVAVLAAGWITDFRYPVRRFHGPTSSWARTADAWLRYCDRNPDGSITVNYYDYWIKAPVSSTFSCASVRR